MVSSPLSAPPMPMGRHDHSLSPSSVHITADGPVQQRKLFIGGLSHDTDDQQLRRFYEQWGTVIDCIVIRDALTKQSRGFGFVTYTKTDMIGRALAALPHIINQKQVDPKPAVPREDMSDDPMPANFYSHRNGPHDHLKFYIKGLTIERSIQPDYYLVDQLRTHFGQFGLVDQVEVSQNPRRLPYIIMDTTQAVAECINHKPHYIAQRKCALIRADHFMEDLNAILAETGQIAVVVIPEGRTSTSETLTVNVQPANQSAGGPETQDGTLADAEKSGGQRSREDNNCSPLSPASGLASPAKSSVPTKEDNAVEKNEKKDKKEAETKEDKDKNDKKKGS